MSDRKKLVAYPITDALQYRQKIDPFQLNRIISSLEESVLRAILRGSEVEDKFNRLSLGVETAYMAMAKHVSMLNSYEHVPSGTLFASAFESVAGDGRTDSVAGITTLSWDESRKFSCIPRYDSDEDGVPDIVTPNVTVYVDGTARTTDDSVYNALNKRNDSFWIEQATAGDHTIEIQLPASLNKSFNYIELAPFPVFGVDIKKVEYFDVHSKSVTLYDHENNEYKFFNSSGPLVIHCAPKDFNNTIKITVTVDSSILAMGFSSIDIGYIDYDDTVQTAYFKFVNMPSRTGTTTYTLKVGELDFYVDDVNHSKYITEASITNALSGGDTVSMDKIDHASYDFGGATIDLTTTQNLYLKVVMKENARTTPVIRGCKLTYEV